MALSGRHSLHANIHAASMAYQIKIARIPGVQRSVASITKRMSRFGQP